MTVWVLGLKGVLCKHMFILKMTSISSISRQFLWCYHVHAEKTHILQKIFVFTVCVFFLKNFSNIPFSIGRFCV